MNLLLLSGRRLAAPSGFVLLALVPLMIHSPYILTVLINALIFTLLAMSLNIIYGYAGLLSFAQVGFWGLGGYIASIGAVKLGVSPWAGAAVALLTCAILAVGLSAASLRLSNHAFVIVSIAFTLLMQTLSQQWISVTNGPMGISNLPALALGHGRYEFQLASPTSYYYFSLIVFTASMAAIYAIVTSRIGQTLRLVRHDETLARSYGIRVTRWKLFAAAFAAMFACLAGVLNVFFLTIVDPSIFDIYYTQLMIVIVIIGGLGTFWPVLVAGFLMTFLPELLRTPNEIRMINFGMILIVAVVLFPMGFAGLLRQYPLGNRNRKGAVAAVEGEASV